MGVDFFPVFTEVADGVAQGMGVFAGKHWAGVARIPSYVKQSLPAGVFRPFRQSVPVFRRIQVGIQGARIETRDDVHVRRVGPECVALRPFVVDEPRGVEFPEPGSGRGEISPPARLVPEAPENHAGMVAVAPGHAHCAVQKGPRPLWVACQFPAQSVLLNVGLVEHVQAVTVTQFVPFGAVGIVAGANGIEVGLLHEYDVPKHHLFRDHLS